MPKAPISRKQSSKSFSDFPSLSQMIGGMGMGTRWGLKVSYPPLAFKLTKEAVTDPEASQKEGLPELPSMGLEIVNLPTASSRHPPAHGRKALHFQRVSLTRKAWPLPQDSLST